MSSRAGDEAVFKALASGHRRRILDLLAKGPRTTSQIEAKLRPLSRFAVMQHLDVLTDARLVLVRREGRQRFNHLNAVPFRRAYERWVTKLGGQSASALLALEEHLEGEREMPTQARSIEIESEIRINAPQARVFRALTAEQLDWYPHNYGGEHLKAIVCEEFVGGRMYEDWGDGRGTLYGFISWWEPPRALVIRGHLQPAITLEQRFVCEPDGDATVLRHTMVAFGDISDEMAKGIRTHGNLSLYAQSLQDWCERGDRVGAERTS